MKRLPVNALAGFLLKLMALNHGIHPHVHQEGAPATGRVEHGDFETFEDFFNAWRTQQKYLVGSAADLNKMLAKAHAHMRPTPFLSALMQGSMEKALDVTAGGATYNSSGTANIGLADVTDALMAIKTLVYDTGAASFSRLKAALDTGFRDDPELLALIQSRVPRFGSGSRDSIGTANRVAAEMHGMQVELIERAEFGM